MDPRKDIDISGNRVVNVADPNKPNHVATKGYVDTLHYVKRPIDDREEYVRYINLRNTTCLSLAALCTIDWDLEWEVEEDRGIVKEATGPHVLLESTTAPTILHVTPQELAQKTITVEYYFPVVVKNWHILLYLKGEPEHINLKYAWEVSVGDHWAPITLAQQVQYQKKKWCGNDIYLTFFNPGDRPYQKWRIHITEGRLIRAVYINQIYMTVE